MYGYLNFSPGQIMLNPNLGGGSDEPLNDRIDVKASESLKKDLHKTSREVGYRDASAFAREALRVALERVKKGLPIRPDPEKESPHWATAGTNQHSAPRFFSLPCGPWSDSLAEPDRFTVNERVYSFLEMREGDIFASTSGDSMDGAGIRDHDIVVLRPFEPGKGPVKDNIVVATITTIDGDVKSTLKRYIGKDGEKPRLVDGNGDPFDVPQDTEKVEMYYKAVARIGVL